jgi:ATP-dependent phosphoenolpyruvate carboxykinase
MCAKYKLMIFFLFIVIITLTACSTLPPTSNASPISSATSLPLSGNHHKLFVFLSGFTSSLSTTDAMSNGGYGSDPDFFSPGHIQPFLQSKFPGSFFLT